jgi:UDP-N-acetylglucosamine 2-epimerase (non-hydrolysing)
MTKKKIRVLSIFGTRPEAIKMAPVVLELASRSDQFDSQVCITSQHKEMLQQVLDVFEIEPTYDLDLMKPNQDLFDITEGILSGIKGILNQAQPDMALVHGDTTTTFAAALACFYCGIPVGHVEAGLRTRDKRQPFPEEINRRLADVICDLHFAPTKVNQKNLLGDGAPPEGIVITGNTVVDALLGILPKARSLEPSITGLSEIDWNLRTILVTCHRRESFGEQIEGICRALKMIVTDLPDVNLVYPVHKNPNVLGPVTKILGDVDRIYLTEPLDYLPFIWLMERCHIVLTDSGGIQEEAPSLDKPVLVMRNKTERAEAVETGAVVLAGTSGERIVEEVKRLFSDPEAYDRMARAKNPYGDGKASQRIADAILKMIKQ